MEMLRRNVVLNDFQSFSYFQKVLKDKGVIKALYKAGAVEGDTVRIEDIEFELVD
jgi:GTP-binding protein